MLGWQREAVAQASTPGWQLAMPTPGQVTATAAGPLGDVYLTGWFQGSASFGNTTLTSTGGFPDVFVAKWNAAAGRFDWALQGVGAHADRPADVVVSGNNVYVYGEFFSPDLNFGGQNLHNASSMGAPAPSISSDLFVVKLSDAGSSASVVWAERAGSGWDDYATALSVSGSNVYATGYFSGLYTLLGTSRLFNAGALANPDGFVAKLLDAGSSGRFAWGLSFGGPDYEESLDVAVGSSAVYVVGTFTSPSLTWGTTTLTRLGSDDSFVAKIVDAGTGGSPGWVQRLGGTSSDVAAAVAASGNHLYVAGSFTSASLVLGGTTLSNAGATNTAEVFVTKLTDAGSTAAFAWAHRAGGASSEFVRGIALNGAGVYLTGVLGGAAADFGSTTLVSAGGTADVFVTRLTDAGSTAAFAWAASAGGSSVDHPSSVAAAGTRVYVCGVAVAPALFAPLTLTSSGGFLAAVADPVLAAAPARRPATVAVYPNPAREYIDVALPDWPAGTRPPTLLLHAADGRVVRTATLPRQPGQRPFRQPLAGLPPGLYLLQVTTGTVHLTQHVRVH
ncbi:hypothetical protein GCM10027048_21260 [Hymenobacter coalescens]